MPSAALQNAKVGTFEAMIVSRYMQYFVEYRHDIARQTFVWIHDVRVHVSETRGLPYNTTSCIDGYVCSSPWHKEDLIESYGWSANKIHVIGLGIDVDACRRALARNFPRQRNKFIWVSDHRRNLAEFIQQFIMVKAYIEDAELHIYRELPAEYVEKYKNLDYIKLHGYQTNETILEAMSTSDYFCYLTEFKETYCLSAHEAQAMGCVCICSPLAALNTTVDDRGILLKNSLVQTLLQLDESEKTAMRERAQEWALANDWAARANAWRALLKI